MSDSLEILNLKLALATEQEQRLIAQIQLTQLAKQEILKQIEAAKQEAESKEP